MSNSIHKKEGNLMKTLMNCGCAAILTIMFCFGFVQQAGAGCCNEYVIAHPCGCNSACGPVGSAADALLAIPARIIGSLTGWGYNCGCYTNNCCGYACYPRGCSAVHCPGCVADVAPRRTEVYYTERVVPVPAYVTYGIVDRGQAPARPIPPVISFNGPLVFEQR